MGNIIQSTEKETGNKPQSLRVVGFERILDRKILSWCSHYGSYGMGGPGFFGLELAKTECFKQEHLILTLWGAGSWLLIDGVRVTSHPKYYDLHTPLYSNFGPGKDWDKVSPLIVNGYIKKIEIKPNTCKFKIETLDSQHLIELPEKLDQLAKRGNGEERVWYKEDNLLDAWVITADSLLV